MDAERLGGPVRVVKIEIEGDVTPWHLADAARLLSRTLTKKRGEERMHIGVGSGIVTFHLRTEAEITPPRGVSDGN